MSSSIELLQKIAFLTLALCSIALTGCDQSAPETVTETPASTRPPLRVWIADAPELEREISVRWQAASDQALKIESFSTEGFAAREPFHADVVIYPALLLGDLVQKQAIGRLPPQAISKRDSEDADKTAGVGAAAWPVRWRNSTSFGGQLYAMPLGSTNLGIAMVGTEGTFSFESLASGKEFNSRSLEQWTQFLDQNEMKLKESQGKRQSILEQRLLAVTPTEKSFLVDRYLFIAATTDARNRGLFELVKMESRLSLPEFIQSATVMARLALLFPESMTLDPTIAWEQTVSKSDTLAGFAIGWPNTSLSSKSDSSAKVTVPALNWNPGRGLIASTGKKTRQTAVSCQFLAWLAEPEQREAFRSASSRIELTVDQNDRNSVRDDYRAFQSINNRELTLEPMGLSLRMANADQYRAILADALVEILRSPNKVESIMNDSSSKWNQLTAKLGIETQRMSEEQSLGYRK